MTSGEAPEDTLAGAIIALRKEAGSQAKLAAVIGVTERTVKRWERGAVPQEPARSLLIGRGVPAELFQSAEHREEIERRLRGIEGEIARIRGLLA